MINIQESFHLAFDKREQDLIFLYCKQDFSSQFLCRVNRVMLVAPVTIRATSFGFFQLSGLILSAVVPYNIRVFQTGSFEGNIYIVSRDFLSN